MNGMKYLKLVKKNQLKKHNKFKIYIDFINCFIFLPITITTSLFIIYFLLV